MMERESQSTNKTIVIGSTNVPLASTLEDAKRLAASSGHVVAVVLQGNKHLVGTLDQMQEILVDSLMEGELTPTPLLPLTIPNIDDIHIPTHIKGHKKQRAKNTFLRQPWQRSGKEKD